MLNGPHQLMAKAYDGAGFVAVSSVTVVINNTDSSLKGSWSFNEGAGVVAADSSGYYSSGTFINGPAWVDGRAPFAGPSESLGANA